MLREDGRKLWQNFLDLHVTRRMGMGGPERLSFGDLHAWQIMARSPLEPWEVRAILRLDHEYMAFASAEAAKRQGA